MILIYNRLITNHIDFKKTSTIRLWWVYVATIANFNQRHLVKEAEINTKINLWDVEFNMSAASSYRFWNQSLTWWSIPLLSSK